MSYKTVILGAQESGVGAAILAKSKGQEVFVSDFGSIPSNFKSELEDANIPFEEGQHTLDLMQDAEFVIKSPGIADKVAIVQDLLAAGKEVISEIEFAYKYSKGKVIGITGSNGKTTTTSLVFHMMNKAGMDVVVVGNIGDSYARQVAKEDKAYYVIELSSFQLDGVKDFKPYISVLLNITPDHLDRYENEFQNYIDSKFRVAMNQDATDYFIYSADDPVIIENLESKNIKAKYYPFSYDKEIKEGASVVNKELTINVNKTIFTMKLTELGLNGKHNAYNTMASSIVGRILDLQKEVIRDSMSDFKSLEHRLESVAKIGGVEFINDSKATNVNSTWYALETMQNPTIWIVGGVDKGNDYAPLVDLVNSNVKAIVCLGSDNIRIHEAFSNHVDLIVNTSSMDEAVDLAMHLGTKGDSVLLSPACASFDLFESYEDRGQQFKAKVRSL